MSRMTLNEKVAMVAGSGWMESQANARLGIPAIKMADGPMGIRSWTGSSAVTKPPTRRCKVNSHGLSRRHGDGRHLGPGPGRRSKAKSSPRKPRRWGAT